MSLGRSGATSMIGDTLWPAWRAEVDRLDKVDDWYRYDHEKPHSPNRATKEYKELGVRAQTPWGLLIVTAVAQVMYVDDYRRANDPDSVDSWRFWQANGLDARQIAIHRAALAYGLSYMTVLPGEDPITREPIPRMRGVSPRRMISVYQDPAEDDWPAFAMRVEPAKIKGAKGYVLRVYDEGEQHRFECDGFGTGLTYITTERHDAGVCPVVRFANQLDLEGRADGEIEPFIPVLGRIDQTVFDRLVVQRFASWVVRTIAGMSPPDTLTSDADGATTTDEVAWRAAEKLRLRAEDILIADDKDTKFGSLPATPLDGFIAAAEADIRALAAVSQTPPQQLLGQLVNLSAEALAAAEAALQRKATERKNLFGESHEQALRLASWISGDKEGARDTSAQVRWRDVESRSLAQAADALGKMAQMLGVPVEMLWEKIPGWTQQDVERAKALVTEGDALTKLAEILEGQATPPEPTPPEG